MITRAQSKHPNLTFIKADVHDDLSIDETFDYIVLSDLINDIWDAQIVFQNLHRFCKPSTRLIINSYSRLWEIPLSIVKNFKLANPVLQQNWFAVEDIRNLLQLSGFETIRTLQEILLPIKIPLLSSISNSGLVRFWPIKHLALTNFIIARLFATRQ